MNNEWAHSKMTAKVEYATPVVSIGLTLGGLKALVDDALQKGMPEDSRVSTDLLEKVMGLVFTFRGNEVEKIECGEHYTDLPTDLLIVAHKCVDDE